MARIIKLYVKLKGRDEDWWFHEYTEADYDREVTLSDSNPVILLDEAAKWGGECRATIRITVQLREDGTVSAFIQVQLFEGTSEDTNELAQQKDETRILPRGKEVGLEMEVNNAKEDDPGTYAKYLISMTNRILEE